MINAAAFSHVAPASRKSSNFLKQTFFWRFRSSGREVSYIGSLVRTRHCQLLRGCRASEQEQGHASHRRPAPSTARKSAGLVGMKTQSSSDNDGACPKERRCELELSLNLNDLHRLMLRERV